MPANICGDAFACNTSNSRADFLDDRHQWIRKNYSPQHSVAELRADLRICADSAGIIVSGSGDQAGAEASENLPEEISARFLQFGRGANGFCFWHFELRLAERLVV